MLSWKGYSCEISYRKSTDRVQPILSHVRPIPQTHSPSKSTKPSDTLGPGRPLTGSAWHEYAMEYSPHNAMLLQQSLQRL